jgi:hypothetical protein
LVGRLKDQPDDLQHQFAERTLLTSDNLQLMRLSGHYLPFCGRHLKLKQVKHHDIRYFRCVISIAGGDAAVVTAVAGTQ